MITSQEASAIRTVGRADGRHARRVVVWLAALVAAATLAATAGFVGQRVTSSDGTVAPATGTVQPVAPQERAVDPGRRLIRINDQAAAAPVTAAPGQKQHVTRLSQIN